MVPNKHARRVFDRTGGNPVTQFVPGMLVIPTDSVRAYTKAFASNYVDAMSLRGMLRPSHAPAMVITVDCANPTYTEPHVTKREVLVLDKNGLLSWVEECYIKPAWQ